ncbi:hypothetical protein [Embleya sp. NPDC005575]|uniref:hypothetical protein n=1 Tax=Embleya sp. NPDC005575 TaxID=3156892 RepID=UPI0033A350A5
MSVFTPPARARAGRSGSAVAAISILASAGYLTANLLPAFLDAVRTGLGLSGTAAGAIGTAVLLGSALAGAAITCAAGGTGRERQARTGLLLMVGGFTVAALTGSTCLAVAGAIVGGVGSGPPVQARPPAQRRSPAQTRKGSRPQAQARGWSRSRAQSPARPRASTRAQEPWQARARAPTQAGSQAQAGWSGGCRFRRGVPPDHGPGSRVPPIDHPSRSRPHPARTREG